MARAAGVSQTTVSLVLAGKSEGRVKPETDQAVREAARRLGYRPNTAARNLRLGRTRTILLVVPTLTSPFFGAVYTGAARVAGERGFGVVVHPWDDDAARRGYCLYKVGCKGPTTYNACSTVRWNGGTSFPIQAGHGCIGCSEDGFWDKGSFYDRLTQINQFGIEANADRIGGTAAVVVGAAAAAHAAASAIQRASSKQDRNGR